MAKEVTEHDFLSTVFKMGQVKPTHVRCILVWYKGKQQKSKFILNMRTVGTSNEEQRDPEW